MRAVAFWDLPTRIFHWALVVAVVVSVLTGGEEGVLFDVHTVSGLFKLVVAFVPVDLGPGRQYAFKIL